MHVTKMHLTIASIVVTVPVLRSIGHSRVLLPPAALLSNKLGKSLTINVPSPVPQTLQLYRAI